MTDQNMPRYKLGILGFFGWRTIEVTDHSAQGDWLTYRTVNGLTVSVKNKTWCVYPEFYSETERFFKIVDAKVSERQKEIEADAQKILDSTYKELAQAQTGIFELRQQLSGEKDKNDEQFLRIIDLEKSLKQAIETIDAYEQEKRAAEEAVLKAQEEFMRRQQPTVRTPWQPTADQRNTLQG